MSERRRLARLDAVAAVRAHLSGDQQALRHLIDGSPEPGAMADAAAGFAAALIRYTIDPRDHRTILDEMVRGTIGEPHD